MKHAAVVTLFSLALSAATSALGHDGEDHGAVPPPVTRNVEPRATAATDEFEVVASLEGNQLVVYVDRFASNEPVAQARVEIESAGLRGVASEIAPGTYVLELATPLPPARQALTIIVETGDSVDLLTATLEIADAMNSTVHTHGWSEWLAWLLSGALLLAGGILIVVRRHRHAGRGGG